MLKQEHIAWYQEDIGRAQRSAIRDIETAEAFAKITICHGCSYCRNLNRHKKIVESASRELMLITQTLKEGLRAAYSFPKKMYPDATLYRGFITDAGEYIHLHKTGHEEYRKQCASERGEESAYKMINVHGFGRKTQVQFFDRKHPPNERQFATLRELMIDAEGSLSFYFMFDSNHPS